MKNLLIFLFTIISFLNFGQVTLLSPTGDGGFETGATAAANGWTATVGTATQNQWIVGSAYAYGGSRGAYITNATSTAPNSYTNSAARVSHLYRNFTLPTNTATATLSFYWKGTGESCCDYMSVYFEPATNAAPVYGTQKALTGTAPTGIINAATANTTRTRYNASFAGYTTSQLITITIPASYFTNTAYRLTFEWRNDGSTGTNPPAAIDNVSIVYNVTSTVPTCASLSSPSNGATDRPVTQTITWAATATATGYDVYFGTSATPPLVSSNQAGTTYNPGTLSSNTTYYHKIVPRNSVGPATGCNTWSFTTLTIPSNDNCSGATSLPCATSSLAGTTVNSVVETSPNSLYVGGYGVWYTFTGDGGQTTISATSSIDIGMYIGFGTCASRTQVSSVDGFGAGGTETYTFTTTNSAVYYVYVAYYGVSVITGTFTISRTCVAPCTTPTTAGTLTASKTSTTVNDAVAFTTSGNGGSITKFEYSYDNFSTVEETVNNPANPYTLILNVQQPTIWFRTTSVSGACPEGVTTPISVTLQSAPEYIYGTEDGDYISNVTLNTINNNSTYDSPLGDSYQDFTSISTTLVKGTNYTIYVSSPATFLGYPSGYAAWIDYNNDGIFQTTENIMQQSYGTTKSQSFTVPTTASVALVTMRVLSSWAETPTTDAYDVIGYDWGEIEEYKINITSGLPVELYSFDGVNVGNNNYLFWVTSSEQNTSHFNLQKSRDGENWETMMTLSAAGNSNTQIDYDVVDYKVEPIINYYRLQQYDNDGVYETFGPIAINNMDLNSQKTIIKYINLNGQEIDPEKLDLMDVYIEVYSDGTIRKVIK
jgi:hypothetical protein